MTQAHTRDFSKKRPPVNFTINDERYDCYKTLDIDQLRRFANMGHEMSALIADAHAEVEDAQAEVASTDVNDLPAKSSAARDLASNAETATLALNSVLAMMRIVMKKQSYVRFAAKVNPSDEERESDDFEPVDTYQLIDIIKWLMGIYTARPSRPSPNFSDGSATGDGGSSSTAGASQAESDREISALMMS